MDIKKICSYLAYPSKHEAEQPEIGGADIPHKGRLYEMLKEIFDKSDKECNIPICFLPEEDGTQNNECRNEILDLIKSPSIAKGKKIAERLQSVTTGKSGMGLLFMILSQDKNNHKIMISRFPADQGVMAEHNSNTLKVEFIEQVFLKNANAYKSVIYKGTSFDGDFWTGYAVDRQTNHGLKDVANYWIREFLLSDFKTTSKSGTKRLACALKDAISDTDNLAIKHEITSAAILAKNLSGKNISINDFSGRYSLSEEAKNLIKGQLKSPKLLGDKFHFDLDEFNKHISYKSLEIDNGATLTAPSDKFDQCFQEKALKKSGVKEFVTVGRVVDEKFRRRK